MATQNKPIALNNTPHLPPASSPAFVKGTPTWVQGIITNAAQRFNIPTMVLSGLIKQESGFNPNAQSPVGATGIAQFMPDTAKGMGVNPNDPESAINGAAQYLRNGLNKFGDIKLALAAYNAGSAAVQHYGGIPPYQETQNYVKNIMAMAGEPHESANGPYLNLLTDLKKQSQPSIGTGAKTPAPSYPSTVQNVTPRTVMSGPLSNPSVPPAMIQPHMQPQEASMMQLPQSAPVPNSVPKAPGFNIFDAIGNMFGGGDKLVSPIPSSNLVSPQADSMNMSSNSSYVPPAPKMDGN